jgi:hypothetical protein
MEISWLGACFDSVPGHHFHQQLRASEGCGIFGMSIPQRPSSGPSQALTPTRNSRHTKIDTTDKNGETGFAEREGQERLAGGGDRRVPAVVCVAREPRRIASSNLAPPVLRRLRCTATWQPPFLASNEICRLVIGKQAGEFARPLNESGAESKYVLTNVRTPHHIEPLYLGGPRSGSTAPLNAAYHQLITNEFRRLAPYGSEVPSAARVQETMRQVYEKYPLPPGY